MDILHLHTYYVVTEFIAPSPSIIITMVEKVKAVQIIVKVLLSAVFFIQMGIAVKKYLGNNIYF